MDEDIVEKPVCSILYRQSSIETRLSPAHLSEEDSSDDNQDEESTVPKVVDYKLKNVEINSDQADSLRDEKFCSDLETKKVPHSTKNVDRIVLSEEDSVSDGNCVSENLPEEDFRHNASVYSSDKPKFSAGTLKGKTIIYSGNGILYELFSIQNLN